MQYLLRMWADMPCSVLRRQDSARQRLERALYQCLLVLAHRLHCDELVQLLEAIPDNNDDFRCP
ncbi:hypothetical protein [Herbaspirillum sp. NPDC087042]|uniref:hypothetical protein n=1 Tax=Herbaspirillum sp. NPDC087042 TaxID=3364004 RepID=UPI00382A6D56